MKLYHETSLANFCQIMKFNDMESNRSLFDTEDVYKSLGILGTCAFSGNITQAISKIIEILPDGKQIWFTKNFTEIYRSQ